MDVGGKGRGQAELAIDVDVVGADVLLATLTGFAKVLSLLDVTF